MKEERKDHHMTEESIEVFLQAEQERGLSEKSLQNRRGQIYSLYRWLGEDKLLTEEILRQWKKSMKERGYTEQTTGSHVKSINRYLVHVKREDLRFRQGRHENLTGRRFGNLRAVELTGENERRNRIWLCRCSCGKELEVTATRLLTGNTLSCGCLKIGKLQASNKYIAGTELRKALSENMESSRAVSGYMGVTRKRDKWEASIAYRGKRYYLGCYTRLEDAVKARARAKELVQEDARKLLDIYEKRQGKEALREWELPVIQI